MAQFKGFIEERGNDCAKVWPAHFPCFIAQTVHSGRSVLGAEYRVLDFSFCEALTPYRVCVSVSIVVGCFGMDCRDS